jgi:septum formation protein
MALRDDWHYVLGSRSPRRLELLQQIVPPESIEVLPPRSSQEANFIGLSDWARIESRLLEIAREKCKDVVDQLHKRPTDLRAVVIAADTVVVVGSEDKKLLVLGQPPEDPTWPETVRRWFLDYYAGQTHVVATALCVAMPDRQRVDRVVRSSVTFHDDVSRWLEWYLATGEPRGKADVFVAGIEGSLSNVIGLPLRELLEVLERETDKC